MNKQGHAVRLPQYMGLLLGKWRRVAVGLRDALGREPLPAEVAARLGLTRQKARAVAKALKVVGLGGVGGENGDLDTLTADARESAPGDQLATADDIRAALGSLDHLGVREAAVIRLRFGLDGGEPMTLRDVGERFGLTRERARQIEREALAALRAHLAA